MNWRKPVIESINVENVIHHIALKASSGNSGIGDEDDCLSVYGDQNPGFGGIENPGVIPPPCIPGPYGGCNDISLFACAKAPVFSVGSGSIIA